MSEKLARRNTAVCRRFEDFIAMNIELSYVL